MKQILIPKPRSEDKRPLTISSPIKRIVRKFITSVLELIYELSNFLPRKTNWKKVRSRLSASGKAQLVNQWPIFIPISLSDTDGSRSGSYVGNSHMCIICAVARTFAKQGEGNNVVRICWWRPFLIWQEIPHLINKIWSLPHLINKIKEQTPLPYGRAAPLS